jgi:hypothetical protein
LGRRFAVLSAGLEQHDPEHGYRVRLFVDERREGTRRALAVSYIELARGLDRMAPRDFLANFGVELSRALADMPGRREDNLQQLFELHRRFGSQVMEVLAEAFRQHARELAEGKLPDHCLMRLAAAPDDTPAQVDRATVEGLLSAPEIDQTRMGPDFLFDRQNIKLALDHQNELVVIEGLKPFSGDQMFPLFGYLVDLRDVDVAEKRRDENYGFIARDKLAEKLQCDEDGLGALIYRTRRRVSEAAEVAGAPALSQNDIIESKRSSGYRLRPTVRVIALSEIRR